MEIDEQFISYALGFKDKRVREMTTPGSDDMPPIVLWKDADGVEIGKLHCGSVERDHALDGIMRLTAPFAAHEIILAIDIHYTDKPLDPRTNKPWAPGAMQNFCDGGDGCLLGFITDGIATLGMDKSGAVYQVIYPYHVHKGDKTVAWQEREVMESDGSAIITGLLPDTIREALAQPTILEFASEHGLDLTDDRRNLLELQVEATLTIGYDPRWVITLLPRDDEEEALITAAAATLAERQAAMRLINDVLQKVRGK